MKYKKAYFLSELHSLRSLLSEEKADNEKLRADIRSYVAEAKVRETKIKELVEEIRLKDEDLKEQSQKVEAVQNQARSFKRTLDENLDQLATIKDLMMSWKKEKEELTFERDSLKKRAAVAFEDLTPRPNYQKLMEEKKVELGIKVDAFWKGNTSLLSEM